MKSLKKMGQILLAGGVMGALACAFTVNAFAAESGGITGFGPGMAYLGAALSTGVAAIGGGIAVGAGAPAAIGALTEDAKSFGKSLIFVALGEGIALYGMLISILILNKV
jgi:V/A-type H+-transporting ATPase subunit K